MKVGKRLLWTLGVIGLVLVVLAGVAFAAWIVTRTADVEGVVDGAHVLQDIQCDSAAPGFTAQCTVVVVSASEDMLWYVGDPVVTTTNPDVVLSPPVIVSGMWTGDPGNLDVGEDMVWAWDYTPSADAPGGAVPMTVEVTMQNTAP